MDKGNLREMLLNLINFDKNIVEQEERRERALYVGDEFDANAALVELVYLEIDKECIMCAIEELLRDNK